jgi:hypothetical protein
MRHGCIDWLFIVALSASAVYAQDNAKAVHFKSVHGVDGIPGELVKAASQAALMDSMRTHRLEGRPDEYSVFAESRVPADCNDCARIQLNLFREGHMFSLRRPKKCFYKVIADPKSGDVDWIAGPIVYTIGHKRK